MCSQARTRAKMKCEDGLTKQYFPLRGKDSFYLFIFDLLVFVAARGLSTINSCSRQGLLFCGARASHCSGSTAKIKTNKTKQIF